MKNKVNTKDKRLLSTLIKDTVASTRFQVHYDVCIT